MNLFKISGQHLFLIIVFNVHLAEYTQGNSLRKYQINCDITKTKIQKQIRTKLNECNY